MDKVPFSWSASSKEPGLFGRIVVGLLGVIMAVIFSAIAYNIALRWKAHSLNHSISKFIITGVFFTLALFMASAAILMVTGPGSRIERYVKRKGIKIILATGIIFLAFVISLIVQLVLRT